jgi:hypothetical protein
MWLNLKEIIRKRPFHKRPEKLKIDKSGIGSNQISKKEAAVSLQRFFVPAICHWVNE